jgi:hypothetical protein
MNEFLEGMALTQELEDQQETDRRAIRALCHALLGLVKDVTAVDLLKRVAFKADTLRANLAAVESLQPNKTVTDGAA